MRMFDQTKIAGEAARLLEDAVTGIMLTLTASSTPTVAAIGNVAYATEPGSGRLIYSLEPSASASMTSSTSYEASALADASRMTRSITRQDELRTVVRLLARSVQTTDNMQAFLTAWRRSRFFLHKTFRDTYEQTIFAKLADRAAPSEQAFVKRLRDVMAGKYNIKDKFRRCGLRAHVGRRRCRHSVVQEVKGRARRHSHDEPKVERLLGCRNSRYGS